MGLTHSFTLSLFFFFFFFFFSLFLSLSVLYTHTLFLPLSFSPYSICLPFSPLNPSTYQPIPSFCLSPELTPPPPPPPSHSSNNTPTNDLVSILSHAKVIISKPFPHSPSSCLAWPQLNTQTARSLPLVTATAATCLGFITSLSKPPGNLRHTRELSSIPELLIY